MADDIDMKAAAKAVEDINKAWDAQKHALAELDAEVKRHGAELPETKAKLEKMDAAIAKAQEVADAAVLAVKRQSRVVTDDKGNSIDLDAKALEWW